MQHSELLVEDSNEQHLWPYTISVYSNDHILAMYKPTFTRRHHLLSLEKKDPTLGKADDILTSSIAGNQLLCLDNHRAISDLSSLGNLSMRAKSRFVSIRKA